MTVIAGYIGKNNIAIFGDRQVSGSTNYITQRPKIIAFKDFLIGGCGRAKAAHGLQWWKPPRRGVDESIDHYIECTILGDLRKYLTDRKSCWEKDKEEDTKSEFLIVTDNAIYRIGCDFYPGKLATNYSSIGCGEKVAIGALGAWKAFSRNTDDVPSEKDAGEIVKLVSNTVDGVSEQFDYIIRQKNTQNATGED